MALTEFPQGVLNAQMLTSLMASGAVKNADPNKLQPASLDLTFSDLAWRVRASFLSSKTRTVEDRLHDGLVMHEISLAESAVFERGCVYLVKLREELSLPEAVAAFANPKSSTGRIDVFVRLMTDYGATFDEAPAGYSGPLYAEISPRSFSIIVREGSTLNQLRLKNGECAISDVDLRKVHDGAPIVSGEARINRGLSLTVNLSGETITGWRARRHTGLIDVDKKGALDPFEYFEPIHTPGGRLILDPDEFYILASKEAIVIPPQCAAEMAPINPTFGEFRVHYAGFFDPGFGWSPANDRASRAVLEVRSRETPYLIEDGQLVAQLAYEQMALPPDILYGDGLQSNYQGQGLKLSKHFRPVNG